jgi:hypothetical protein
MKSSLSLPLFNRDFSLPQDGKIHVVPMGEFPVEYNGKQIVQVVDDRACKTIVTNLRTDAQAPEFAGLCMDFDHFRHDPTKESRAAAWVMDAEQRKDGVFAVPRWTTSGQTAVAGGDYRFISPEFDPYSLEALGGNRFRVTRLVGFGLTNNPNMRGMTPLVNAHGSLTRAVSRHQVEAENAGAIAAKARELRAKDKRLSVAAGYKLAKDQVCSTGVLLNRAVISPDGARHHGIDLQQLPQGRERAGRRSLLAALPGGTFTYMTTSQFASIGRNAVPVRGDAGRRSLCGGEDLTAVQPLTVQARSIAGLAVAFSNAVGPLLYNRVPVWCPNCTRIAHHSGARHARVAPQGLQFRAGNLGIVPNFERPPK